MELFEVWSNSPEMEEAGGYFPNETDLGALWHADYFRREPIVFMKSVQGHASTLAEPQRTQYLQAIRSYLDRNFEPGHIQTQIVADRSIGEWFLVSLYPDWGEWYASWRIMYDLEQWLKDTVQHQKWGINTAADRDAYIIEVNRLLDAYGPDNWAERVSKETVLEWTPIFKKAEIAEVQQAAVDLKELKTQKTMGLFLVGGFAIFGLSFLWRKRNRSK